MNHFHSIIFAIQGCCIASIIAGIYHIRKITPLSETIDEPISALSTYIRDSTNVFIKRQGVLTAGAVVVLTVGSIIMSKLELHNKLFPILVSWGIVWSTIIGYGAIRISNRRIEMLLHQSINDPVGWRRNTQRLGWAITLIPLGILFFLLNLWMSGFQFALFSDTRFLGSQILHQSISNSNLLPEIAAHFHIKHIIQSEAEMLLTFCFGILIQTFLVKITTQSMRQSTHTVGQLVDEFFPGIGPSDLRNPASMAHQIALYADVIWGNLSVAIDRFLTAVLTSTIIMLMTLKATHMPYSTAFIRIPFLVIALGLAAASWVSWTRSHASVPQQTLGVSLIITIGAVISFFTGVIPLGYLWCIVASVIFSGMVGLKFGAGNDAQHRQYGYLLLVSIVTLVWASISYKCCDSSQIVLLGMDGIGIGIVTVLATSIPRVAATFSRHFQEVTASQSEILGHRQSIELPQSSLISDVIINCISTLLLFMTFLSLLPYWISKVSHPVVTSILQKYSSMHILEVGIHDIHNILYLSPTSSPFLFGLFLSIALILGNYAYWEYHSQSIESKLYVESQNQLTESPAIIEGKELPKYETSIQRVTTHSFRRSFEFLGILAVLGLGIVGLIGLGGITGALVGLMIITGFIGLVPRGTSETAPIRVGYLEVQLTTKALLILTILFSVVMLNLGLGL
ncbi:hypothetical protein EB093_06700 [bacterium]|nr:hypothetical protein [bacterium]